MYTISRLYTCVQNSCAAWSNKLPTLSTNTVWNIHLGTTWNQMWTDLDTLQPNLLIFCMVLLFLFLLCIILHHSQVRICFGLVIPTGMAKSRAVSIHTQHNTTQEDSRCAVPQSPDLGSKFILQYYAMMICLMQLCTTCYCDLRLSNKAAEIVSV